MIKSLFQYNRKKLIVAIIIFVLVIVFFYPLMGDAVKSITETGSTPDTDLGYSLEDLKQLREIYGPEGAEKYFFTRITYDFLWPIAYGFFLINIGAFLLDGVKRKWVPLIKVLPFMAFFFDLFENIFCSAYFFYGQNEIGRIAVFSSGIKWLSIFLALASFAFLIGYKLYRKQKKIDTF